MRTDTIVIGMDFSTCAVEAAKWVTDRFAPGAALTLVHAVVPADRPRFAVPFTPDAGLVEAIAAEDAERRLRELSSFLTPAETRRVVRTGRPHEVILAVAREVEADLVVLGPHDDRPRPTGMLGSTADRIARTSPVNVLIVRSPQDHDPRTLVVPVDDAPITPALLDAADTLAERFDAEVTLLHCWSDGTYGDAQLLAYTGAAHAAGGWTVAEQAMRDAGTQWLQHMAETGLAPQRMSAIVARGTAGSTTLEVAKVLQAELIVLGRQGSGQVAPLLLGSTVGTVVRGATCPVLVVTGPLPDAEHPW